MFPMEFDYRILSSLPLPTEERIRSVTQLLKALVLRRVVPYFKNKRGTDPLRLARAHEHLSIMRLDDEANQIRTISSVRDGDCNEWIIQIHERIFDYLAFVIPSDPESRLSEGTIEEHKMLAFAEFLLRHEMDHVLYPERKERDVIHSDVDFVLDRRMSDPTFYRMLRSSLTDEMNGIKGESYVTLFDAVEQGVPYEAYLNAVINCFAAALGDMPVPFLHDIFLLLDTELKVRVLGEHYRRSGNTSYTLLQRTSSLRTVLRFFAMLARKNEKEATEVFQGFKDRWGVVGLFHELGLPEASVDVKAQEELFSLFKATLRTPIGEEQPFGSVTPGLGPSPALSDAKISSRQRPEKSLKDRIEEARNDPFIPRRVIEVIDKNKLNAVGHSGSKYSELIETLLAIPWGKIQKIRVSPEVFEEGLNRSHYGLQRPKEIVCDFFTNLIWRYQHFTDVQAASWHQTGSAFLFVGPPGVGKTSLAISIAQNLGIPYHKVSLAGMRDEADIRGHGFTYEGSKPGAIVQGLIKMEMMNGMFILDEADKMEKFAIATLLEILDPEQNHLYHDKYTETTVDIDLSNCHFFLTANTLDAVPPVVVNRCEVVFLDRYSVEEKIAIARNHLIWRVRNKYQIEEEQIFFDPDKERDLLRYLIRTYTYEAGVRELERIIRTLLLRIQRKEILTKGKSFFRITREMIKEYLKEPTRPRQANEEDAVGEMMGLGVNVELGVGSVIPIQATRIAMGSAHAPEGTRRGFLSIVHATGNIEKVMDESRKVAGTGIFYCADALDIDPEFIKDPVHLHFMGGSTRKDGPSAGGAIALALASLLSEHKLRRDVAMTGEIDTKGRITGIGGLAVKIETAYNAGIRTVIIPRENLYGDDGIERFPDALKEELQILTYEEWAGAHAPFDYTRHILQVVAIDNIVQAAKIAYIDDEEMEKLDKCFEDHAFEMAEKLRTCQIEPSLSLRLVQVKKPEELDPEFLRPTSPERVDSLYCKRFSKLTLLVRPEVHEAILARLAQHEVVVPVQVFDPRRENLTTAACEIFTAFQTSLAEAASPARISIIAPYFFIQRDGISLDQFTCGPNYEGMTLFANNYTAQGVKIKGCKAMLDRVYCLLAILETSELDTCPFLARKNGVYVIDMSFIPEKYALDVHRAEQIVNRSLRHWLSTVKGSL